VGVGCYFPPWLGGGPPPPPTCALIDVPAPPQVRCLPECSITAAGHVAEDAIKVYRRLLQRSSTLQKNSIPDILGLNTYVLGKQQNGSEFEHICLTANMPWQLDANTYTPQDGPSGKLASALYMQEVFYPATFRAPFLEYAATIPRNRWRKFAQAHS